jgi:hypothetical protein
MSCDCHRSGYGQFFNKRFARRVARKYRKRGLDGPSQRIADFVVSRGVEGATVLEIGGGVGEIQLELLKAGAARTLNLELSPEYDDEARALAAEKGVAERMERRLHDIAADPTPSSPRTSSSCTASSAATRTTSGCSVRPPTTPAGCLSSATRRATAFRGRS